MARIILNTIIDAPVETCFDLSLSIDFHKASMEHSHEKAVGGVTKGLIGEGQSVTWRAIHFFIPFYMTVQITSVKRPLSFHDAMTKGPFSEMTHHHYFKSVGGKTHLTDDFIYTVPLGALGKFVDRLFLYKYMTALLKQRNEHLKKFAEFGEAACFIPVREKI